MTYEDAAGDESRSQGLKQSSPEDTVIWLCGDLTSELQVYSAIPVAFRALNACDTNLIGETYFES